MAQRLQDDSYAYADALAIMEGRSAGVTEPYGEKDAEAGRTPPREFVSELENVSLTIHSKNQGMEGEMGVPAFYHWLRNKYPKVEVDVREEIKNVMVDTREANPNGMEFDNLYLDMNGIIHPCFHPDSQHQQPTSFDEVFDNIFEYIDRLFEIVRPRKLLYMAIAEENSLRRKFENEGIKILPIPQSETLDSNIITPGTEFMDKLSKALQVYIKFRLHNDPGWEKIKDADLIMLALATHEIHFSILREVKVMDTLICLAYQYSHDRYLIYIYFYIQYRRWITSGKNRGVEKADSSKADSGLENSKEKCEKAHTVNGCKSISKKPYKFVNVWTLREYLKLDLTISDAPCEIDLERIVDDFIFICFFTGNDFLPHMPTLEIRENAIDLLMSVYSDEFKRRGGYLVDTQRLANKSSYVDLKRVERFILSVSMYEERIFNQRMIVREKIRRSILRKNAEVNYLDNEFCWMGFYAARGAEFSNEDVPFESQLRGLQRMLLLSVLRSWKIQKDLKRELECIISDKTNIIKQGGVQDKVRLGEQGWRQRYYKEKFHVESLKDIESLRRDLVQKYTEGLCWVLQYYFFGVCSWNWYYPYHYGPFASDLKGLSCTKVTFKMGSPFKPFDQLMGVLPPRSFRALPRPYWNLMTSEDSILVDFYPKDFKVDVDGKSQLWQGIVKLPFIDEERLLSETRKIEKELKDEEVKRNAESMDILVIKKSHSLCLQAPMLYTRHISGEQTHGGMNGFIHPLPEVSQLTQSGFRLKKMMDVPINSALYVRYECPSGHSHIPRLVQNVELPEEILSESDIVREPLWHTMQTQENHAKMANGVKSTQRNPPPAKEIYKGAGSGWGMGRGKSSTESLNSDLNFGSSGPSWANGNGPSGRGKGNAPLLAGRGWSGPVYNPGN
ncbi:hypothetical protein GIB67_019818 [Kingdonia uniflora]|uniref:5'-3' exoribonuclease n=1 Tax=Kingdonia uniflora TaxID=39325 RepID=A0A7J7MKF1_9MAGN|nr:hypothetical protein GIB67_019818 [Kingdonia uniflora]